MCACLRLTLVSSFVQYFFFSFLSFSFSFLLFPSLSFLSFLSPSSLCLSFVSISSLASQVGYFDKSLRKPINYPFHHSTTASFSPSGILGSRSKRRRKQEGKEERRNFITALESHLVFLRIYFLTPATLQHTWWCGGGVTPSIIHYQKEGNFCEKASQKASRRLQAPHCLQYEHSTCFTVPQTKRISEDKKKEGNTAE